MEQAWDMHVQRRWFPTDTRHEERPSISAAKVLAERSTYLTQQLIALPYHPRNWLRRGTCLASLGYPELAVGDAYKARLLCEAGLLPLHSRTLLGWNVLVTTAMEHWLSDHRGGGSFFDRDISVLATMHLTAILKHAYELLYIELSSLQCYMDAMEVCQAANELFPLEQRYKEDLTRLSQKINFNHHAAHDQGLPADLYLEGLRNGHSLARPYPWMQKKHLIRSKSVINLAKLEFEANYTFSRFGKPGPCALNEVDVTKPLSQDFHADTSQLGVFAAHDIRAEEQILLDMTMVAAFSLKSHNLCDNCFGDFSYGTFPSECCAAKYCSTDCVRLAAAYHAPICGKDFDWLYDQSARSFGEKAAMENLLLLRLLGIFILNGNSHPLDHPIVARLKPQYYNDHPVIFTLSASIVQPIRILQQLGVDVFADLRFDTWVLRCIYMRTTNNKRGYMPPGGGCIESLNSLFSFFNHSCSPNTSWASDGSSSIGIFAERDISRGEELRLCYLGDADKLSYAERQVALHPWLGGACGCERCEAEHQLLQQEELQ